jgi:hypothetical protein
MHRSTVAIPVAVLAVLAIGACSSSATQCRVGADCASGVCNSSGHCVPASSSHVDSGVVPTDSGTTMDDGGAVDSPIVTDTGSPFEGADGGFCVPNDDGTIVREEVPMLPGLHANFEIAENVTVDSAGVTNANGTRSWDLSGALSGDHTVLVTTDAPAGQWFSSHYTSATYTTKLSDTAPLLGVFEGTSAALLLLGVASPTSGTGQTELTYNPPANALGVPMSLGTTWTSNSNVTGMAEGLVADYFEQYSSKVDAQGTLKVPYGTFDVLRVQTTLTRTLGGVATITRSFNFVAECFGPIASLTSQTDETQVEFTNAAEARRLTP